jgi:hypothetical protein
MKTPTPWYVSLFSYIRYIWEGKDHKPSIKRLLAILFSLDFVRNFSFAVHRWDEGKSMEGLASALMIEAGLIAATLGLTSYFSLQERKLDQQTIQNGGTPPGGME